LINFVTGNLLESTAECLVNTVNCEGYMGKGIAYQFKLKFPNNNRDYVKVCKSGQLTVGKLHYFKEDNKIIINFPTKDKWREKSKIEYIIQGMDELVKLLPKLNVKSIAIPPLGCGNGGLEWNEVKYLLCNKLNTIVNQYEIFIYEPSKGYSVVPKEQPKLNVSSLALMNMKLNLKKFNSLRLQKAAYFTNIFLGESYFKFTKHKYGPYDNSIPIISKEIKAFQVYYGTKDTKEAYEIAYRIIISEQTKNKLFYLKPAIEKACNYVNEVRNDKDLECIATITFLIENNNIVCEEDIINSFKSWSKDKADRFSEDDIKYGLTYLMRTNIIVKNLVSYEINKRQYLEQ
jgi:O-acetyl-ADP-ribose deacetylase (regulator of RNase III)